MTHRRPFQPLPFCDSGQVTLQLGYWHLMQDLGAYWTALGIPGSWDQLCKYPVLGFLSAAREMTPRSSFIF